MRLPFWLYPTKPAYQYLDGPRPTALHNLFSHTNRYTEVGHSQSSVEPPDALLRLPWQQLKYRQANLLIVESHYGTLSPIMGLAVLFVNNPVGLIVTAIGSRIGA